LKEFPDLAETFYVRVVLQMKGRRENAKNYMSSSADAEITQTLDFPFSFSSPTRPDWKRHRGVATFTQKSSSSTSVVVVAVGRKSSVALFLGVGPPFLLTKNQLLRPSFQYRSSCRRRRISISARPRCTRCINCADYSGL